MRTKFLNYFSISCFLGALLLGMSGCKAPEAVDQALDKTPAVVTVTGSSNSPLSIAASPSSWGFGNVATNSTSNKQFIFSNNSGTNQATSIAMISGSGLTITTDTCSATILTNASTCSILVNFSPGSLGAVTGNLVLPYGTVSTATVAITGTGVTPATSFAFSGFSGIVGTDISNLSATGMTLQWTPQAAASFYKIVQVDSNSNTTVIGPLYTTSQGSYNVQSLTPGETYTFKVNAYDNLSVSDGNNNTISVATTNTTGATFNGWSDVVATGGVSTTALTLDPVLTAGDLATTSEVAKVSIAWEDFTFSPSGTATGYRIYRSSVASPSSCPSASCTLIATVGTVNTYTDSTVTSENTYYYTVYPEVGASVEIVPAIATDSFIKIFVPPTNMSLVHRWIANREMCVNLLGKTWPADIDRTNNYRCAYAWGSTWAPQISSTDKTRWDIGYTYVVDRYKAGCKINQVNNINTATPAVTNGDVFYRQGNDYTDVWGFPLCLFGKAGSWVEHNSATLTTAEKGAMVTNQPGFHPFGTTQLSAGAACSTRSVNGNSMRLLRAHEYMATGAKSGVIVNPSALEKSFIYTGVDHATYGSCNIARASGVPANDNAFRPGAFYLLTSGSYITRNCNTRYKVQDLLGNGFEWMGEQFVDCISAGSCKGVVSSLDSGATMLEDFEFNGTTGLSYSESSGVSWNGQPMFPMFGLPAASVSGTMGSKAVSISLTSNNSFRFYQWYGSAVLGLTTGGEGHGSFSTAQTDWGSSAGRFTVGMGNISSVNSTYNAGIYSFRCVGEVGP